MWAGGVCGLVRCLLIDSWWIETWRDVLSHTRSLFLSLVKQLAVKNVFIRGSVVRYIQIPASEVDTQLLQDSCRKDSASGKGR